MLILRCLLGMCISSQCYQLKVRYAIYIIDYDFRRKITGAV